MPAAAQQPLAYPGRCEALSPYRADPHTETPGHRRVATDRDLGAAPSLGPRSVSAGPAPVGTPPAVATTIPRGASPSAAPQAGGADDTQSSRPRPAFPG